MKDGLYISGESIDKALSEFVEEIGLSKEDTLKLALKIRQLGYNPDETILVENGTVTHTK